jgi:hypothetical protein
LSAISHLADWDTHYGKEITKVAEKGGRGWRGLEFISANISNAPTFASLLRVSPSERNDQNKMVKGTKKRKGFLEEPLFTVDKELSPLKERI